jgi:hypothetical protein
VRAWIAQMTAMADAAFEEKEMNTLSWPAALFQIVTMFILAWTGWIVHVVVIAFYALPLSSCWWSRSTTPTETVRPLCSAARPGLNQFMIFAALTISNVCFMVSFGLGWWVCSIYMGRLRRRRHHAKDRAALDIALPRAPNAPLVEPQTQTKCRPQPVGAVTVDEAKDYA